MRGDDDRLVWSLIKFFIERLVSDKMLAAGTAK